MVGQDRSQTGRVSSTPRPRPARQKVQRETAPYWRQRSANGCAARTWAAVRYRVGANRAAIPRCRMVARRRKAADRPLELLKWLKLLKLAVRLAFRGPLAAKVAQTLAARVRPESLAIPQL